MPFATIWWAVLGGDFAVTAGPVEASRAAASAKEWRRIARSYSVPTASAMLARPSRASRSASPRAIRAAMCGP